MSLASFIFINFLQFYLECRNNCWILDSYLRILLFYFRKMQGTEHGLSSERTPSPTPFSAWLAQPPRETQLSISSWKYSVLISITATLLSIYPDVNISEENKLRRNPRVHLYITVLYLLTLFTISVQFCFLIWGL